MPNIEISIGNYIKQRIFPQQNLRSEFYNRLENICELQVPVSGDLKRQLQYFTGTPDLAIELIRVIEEFPNWEKPVLSVRLRHVLRFKLPNDLYLQFIRIFDRNCCPKIAPSTYGYSVLRWDFGTDLYIIATISTGETAYFEYTTDEGANWVNYAHLNDGQLSGSQPINIHKTAFWSRLKVINSQGCNNYSEINTLTSA